MKQEYLCIAKVGPKKFVKYHVNNLLKFTAFLDKDWSGWTYFNVFNKKGGDQIASFTKNDRPSNAKLSLQEIESFSHRAKNRMGAG
jgi:hypothetical protein